MIFDFVTALCNTNGRNLRLQRSYFMNLVFAIYSFLTIGFFN